MPQLDLEPHQYATRDPKTGQMRRQLSKRWARNWAFIGIAWLVGIFFGRDHLEPETLFGITAMMGVATGIMLQAWLKDLW